MFKLMDIYHPSRLSTKFWRMSKGYMFLRMQHLVIYRITRMLRNQMNHHLFIITYHHHLNLNILKTLVKLFQVIGVTPRPDEVHSTCNSKGAYMHKVLL